MAKARMRLQLGFLLYFGIVLGVAVLPPAVRMWNRVSPHILGLPLSQFMILLLAALLTGGLIAWYYLEGLINRREAAEHVRSKPDAR